MAITRALRPVSPVPVLRGCAGAGLSPVLLCAETRPARLLLEIQCFSSTGGKKKDISVCSRLGSKVKILHFPAYENSTKYKDYTAK